VPDEAPLPRLRVRVRGTVQGVGFRPYVYRQAAALGLTGSVHNDADGVLVEVQGRRAAEFVDRLRREPPPLARISAVEAESCPMRPGEAGFAIAPSVAATRVATSVAPDVCVCDACLAEMSDPTDRRYRYPFLNCTACGPRYTITRRLPYDRPQTAMAGFPLCPACRAEYEDPANRRFHAEPTACPVCGPRLSHGLDEVLSALRSGAIVALKGLGGFHLLCDATDAAAVERLRARKHRDAKPFAVMALNAASAAAWTRFGPDEQAVLEGRERPIVLLSKRPDAGLPEALAPGLDSLGVMLPAAPLHFLLFHEAAGRPDGTGWLARTHPMLLVATSANPSGEPLVTGDAEARARLAGIADLIVTHDRPIVVRCDDSVLRLVDGAPRFLRRARGYVPRAIALPETVPPVLALGGALKTTVCVTRGAEAVLSQHVGTLDNRATVRFLAETLKHLLALLDVTPLAVAHDRHPDFLSTVLALRLGLPAIAVQHHHAHAAAVLAEHGVTGPALAVVLDGYGMGSDGGAWGGELLRLDGAEFRRLGHLRPLPLPGGDLAARQPWRMAAAALSALGRGGEIATRFAAQPLAGRMAEVLASGRVPATSSCGRLFDAAAGLLGVCAVSSYESEAAMRLEALTRAPLAWPAGWRIEGDSLNLLPLLDRLAQCGPAEGADLFHGTLAAAVAAWAEGAARAERLDTIALGGGCFVNRPLAEGVCQLLRAAGLRPLLPLQAPAGDGGLSLGQAWIAARMVPGNANTRGRTACA
jgi:hydrogenase maturation protein HypF